MKIEGVTCPADLDAVAAETRSDVCQWVTSEMPMSIVIDWRDRDQMTRDHKMHVIIQPSEWYTTFEHAFFLILAPTHFFSKSVV